MIDFFWNTASFIIALGILVTIHEFGHFWVARRCGVKVQRFSVGFGPSLYTRTAQDGTEYTLAAIPLGGYVKMLDSRLEKVQEQDLHLAFNCQSVWKRIAIVAAGPAANFILAIIAFWLVFMLGTTTVKPMVPEVEVNSPIAAAGLETPFEVIAIGDTKTPDWQEVNLALAGYIGDEELTLSYIGPASNQVKQVVIDLSQWQFDPKKVSPIESLGFKPYRPTVHLEVAQITPNSAAEQAGLAVGDKFISANGNALQNWQQWVEEIRTHPAQVMAIEVLRDNQTLSLNITPQVRKDELGNEIGHIGVSPLVDSYPREYIITTQYGPVDSLTRGIEKTWHLTALTFDTLGKLITGTISINNLSGPVSIAKGAGASASYGLVYFLGFVALISVNLGLINLFPLPVLDGGHLLYYCIELISGKPVPERIQEIGFRIGGAFILLLMSVALLNDFNLL
ncbi:sigma E protease regulator RseP [Motilimonas sp. 1_MG-2023]|uniref:sigma E protease regulator RseP n=1 Tax=Motilimonas TaxID=1914248 RepID=UPI0026E1EA60|nr:sigma E protease regulator RseP [Motilimonas sp. 1_MG-2023]MDO6525029.1 sigma E protease regulator RseP [Motilimonas sp. 1_MG-2023]